VATPKQTVQEFVAAFVSAWPDRDAARVASFFSNDAVYHNIPMEPVQGREAIEATLADFMTMGGQVRVDVGHIVAEGAIVMVERVDHFVGDQQTIILAVVGVFEVHDGKITAWRDYFDSAGRAAVREDRGNN
jgi:limonene-1,2-epoxide hydrolase